MTSPNISKKLVIIDDDPQFLKEMSEALKSESYHVYTFLNPTEAIETIKTNEIEVVSIDLSMPEIGGIACLRMIKEINEDTACFIVSNNQDPFNDTAKQCLKYGSYQIVNKPVLLDQYRSIIDRGFSISRDRKKDREHRQAQLEAKKLKLAQLAPPLKPKVKHPTSSNQSFPSSLDLYFQSVFSHLISEVTTFVNQCVEGILLIAYNFSSDGANEQKDNFAQMYEEGVKEDIKGLNDRVDEIFNHAKANLQKPHSDSKELQDSELDNSRIYLAKLQKKLEGSITVDGLLADNLTLLVSILQFEDIFTQKVKNIAKIWTSVINYSGPWDPESITSQLNKLKKFFVTQTEREYFNHRLSTSFNQQINNKESLIRLAQLFTEDIFQNCSKETDKAITEINQILFETFDRYNMITKPVSQGQAKMDHTSFKPGEFATILNSMLQSMNKSDQFKQTIFPMIELLQFNDKISKSMKFKTIVISTWINYVQSGKTDDIDQYKEELLRSASDREQQIIQNLSTLKQG